MAAASPLVPVGTSARVQQVASGVEEKHERVRKDLDRPCSVSNNTSFPTSLSRPPLSLHSRQYLVSASSSPSLLSHSTLESLLVSDLNLLPLLPPLLAWRRFHGAVRRSNLYLDHDINTPAASSILSMTASIRRATLRMMTRTFFRMFHCLPL